MFIQIKIFFILASSSFVFGWIVLFAFNPITSTMVKFYEQTKSEYSRDIDHLVSINKNGLWIKENLMSGHRIISADESKDAQLKNIVIFNLDDDYNLIEKISSKNADITKNRWILDNVIVNSIKDGISEKLF